ncbi:unnamed protein product [Fusarium graminearum]|nr:unnamed protein product [Fusarium graminearum]
MATSVPLLQKLPNELFHSILDRLPNRDLKSLHLTCRCLGSQVLLRLNRVFISANPLNVKVFLAVASHEVFRQQVKEIIWDDATFLPVPTQGDYDYHDTEFGYTFDEDDINKNRMTYPPKGKISGWLVQQCKGEIFSAKSRLKEKGRDNEQQRRVDNLMPSREALSCYNRLVQQQDNVIESGADEQAFRYALQEPRFPHLEKVAVTPAAHGFLFFPLYETPIIRAFPYGFVYPIQRGWSCAGHVYDDAPQPAEPWEDEEEKRKLRGFCIVSRHLADPTLPHNISQLSFDNNRLTTGINHHIFDQPNEEYDNLCRTLERPGLKSFTLSLAMGYLSGCDVEDLIAGAHALEEITLQSDYPVDMTCWEAPALDSISLFDIFPVDQWSNGSLKHFGLSGMQVIQDDLISLLGKLPPTLESIELSFLSIIEGTGHYAGILAGIRDKLGWRHRPIDKRIRVCVLVRLDQTDPGNYTCLDKEVDGYLYGSGPPPFGVNEQGGGYAEVDFGNGMQYDEFDPDFARPYR